MADLVVVGHINSVADGRVRRADSERPQRTAVFAVAVDEVLGGDPESLTDGFVYVEIVRPSYIRVEDYASRLPKGEVLLFLADRTVLEGVDEDSAGRPPRAKVFAAYPQGFWVSGDALASIVYVEDLAELPDGWSGIDTIPELVASLAE